MPAAAETDCKICRTVANGGRIRLNRKTASMLVAMIEESRQGLLVKRREAIDSGNGALEMWARGELRDLDRLAEEVERTRVEKGWSDGEPE